MFRRDAIRLTGMASVAAVASLPGRTLAAAASRFVDAPDIVVFCDPALRDPMRRLGLLFRAKTEAPVRLICAPAGIMAAQLVRRERADILVSLAPVVRQLAASGVVDPQPPVGSWRNRLVIAGRASAVGAQPAALPASLAALAESFQWPARLRSSSRTATNSGGRTPGGGKLGAPDPGPNAVVDAPALWRTLGLEPALAGHIIGEVDTGGVAWLLAHDRVALGLVLLTEARSAGFPTAIAIPDEAYPAVRYVAAFNRHVLSRNAAAFMQFMASGVARASLVGSGLEIET